MALKFKFKHHDKEYDVEIAKTNGQTKIIVNGKDFIFGEKQELQVAAVPQTMIPKRDLATKEVRAVLAGTISEINVDIGNIVKPGQKLLTLSAMKMENEILAECKGKIKEIKITKDQKVKEGDTLITLA